MDFTGFSFRILSEILCPVHVNGELEFVYVETGSLRVLHEGKEFIVHEGEMAVIAPYNAHGFYTQGKSRVWVLMIPYEIAYEYVKKYSRQVFSAIVFKPSPVMIAYLKTFYKEISNGNKPDIFAQKACFYCLISEYISSTPIYENIKQPRTLINCILEYLVENMFTEEITLEKIASAVGTSVGDIKKQFKVYIGTTLHEFLNNMRMDRAKDLLEDKDLSITDVAFMCGFNSVRTFNRTFKETYRMTPSEFRSKEQEKTI